MNSPRVHELIAGFLDGHATSQDVAALDEMLQSSPEAVDLFVQCASSTTRCQAGFGKCKSVMPPRGLSASSNGRMAQHGRIAQQ